ncbi:spore coat protein GerQ [Bacillus massilioanorexius]|uniref:spore coat protein GerQ n=1 Tax=Bacillus TaxID=1386 RepID=UPI0002D5D1CC
MNENRANPYANYGYQAQPTPTPYYGTMQGAQPQPQQAYQQPQQQQPFQQQQMPSQQPMQTYQGGFLEPSGGVLVPTKQNGTSKAPQIPGMLPLEQSYIENILRLNKGKLATVYMTFENNTEWNAKIFKGIIEAGGRDHIILSDPQTGLRYILLMVYLDYITFDEEIEYEYPFTGGPQLATYPPR